MRSDTTHQRLRALRDRPRTQAPNPLPHTLASPHPLLVQCPLPGCIRKREVRQYTKTGMIVYRAVCQAHRGQTHDLRLDPPKTKWKPTDTPPPRPRVPPISPERTRTVTTDPRSIAHAVLNVTTASDGTWSLTREDLNVILTLTGMRRSALDISEAQRLSRPLPTSVVYRVQGMAERGELDPILPPPKKKKGTPT